MLPVEEVRSKKRRVESEQMQLETEETIDPEAFREFEEKMKCRGMGKTHGAWKLLFDEVVIERLKERHSTEWMRVMCQRGLSPTGVEKEEEQEPEEGDGERIGGSGSVEPDEGRALKNPTLPYVPTARERREHHVTHYLHRTWCEVCMAGRAVAGKHSRGRDEVDPNAGKLDVD